MAQQKSTRTVYVVEVGAYSNRYISAIFTTRELAERYVAATIRNSWERMGPNQMVSPGSWTYNGTTRTTITVPATYEKVPLPPDSLPFKEWRKQVEKLTGNWNEFGDVEAYDLWDVLPINDDATSQD